MAHTATRHKPFHNDGLSHRFIPGVTSYDEYDGWVELGDLLENWPPADRGAWHRRHLGAIEKCLRGRRWAYRALA
eukprot:3065597-Pyramimonas_sp.AAC.1